MGLPFTGIHDLDLANLTKLSDQDLGSICQVNRYARKLCSNENLWRQRTLLFFGPEYLIDKPEELTWREWYLFWHRHYPDPIGKLLNLTPWQDRIRLLTQMGQIIPGSEVFEGIDISLKKAFQSQNPELVDYFMEVYRRFYTKYLNSNSIDILIDYGGVISAALQHGFRVEAAELDYNFSEVIAKLESISPNINGVITYEFNGYLKIVEAIGSLGLSEWYQKISEYLRRRNYILRDIVISYISGLVIGRHNKEAIVLISSYLKTYRERYHLNRSLIRAAFKGNNLDILPQLEETIVKNNEETKIFFKVKNKVDLLEYHRIFARVALEMGHPELAVPYEDLLTSEEVGVALAKSDPELALEHFQENINEISGPIEEIKTCSRPLIEFVLEHNPAASIDLEGCPLETIIYVLERTTPENQESILFNALKEGRYDLAIIIKDIVAQLQYLDIEAFWDEVLTDVLYTLGRKDLLIYLLLKIREVYPEIIDEYFEATEYLGNYEIQTLLTTLSKIDSNNLDKINYHDFLKGLVP